MPLGIAAVVSDRSALRFLGTFYPRCTAAAAPDRSSISDRGARIPGVPRSAMRTYVAGSAAGIADVPRAAA